MKKTDFERHFEQRFGASSGRGFGAIGSLAGEQLRECNDEIMAKKDMAMKEAMMKLKVKRERMSIERCVLEPQQPALTNPVKGHDRPRLTQEEFLATVERSALSGIERGLQSADEKTVAMYEAMKTLREKRKAMSSVSREKRTR